MTNANDKRLLVVARALADCRRGDDDPAWHLEDAATILAAIDAHDAATHAGGIDGDECKHISLKPADIVCQATHGGCDWPDCPCASS